MATCAAPWPTPGKVDLVRSVLDADAKDPQWVDDEKKVQEEEGVEDDEEDEGENEGEGIWEQGAVGTDTRDAGRTMNRRKKKLYATLRV